MLPANKGNIGEWMLSRYARLQYSPGNGDNWIIIFLFLRNLKLVDHINGRYYKLQVKKRRIIGPPAFWTKMHHNTKDIRMYISPTYHLVIKTSNTILESIPLLFSKHTLQGFCRGDSMLFIHKINLNSRRYRIQFRSENKKSSEEQCQCCFSVLSQYVTMKQTDTATAEDALLNSQKSVTHRLSGEVTAADVISALTNNPSTTQLPEAYQQEHEDVEGLNEILMLCLADSTFPSFVGLVEKHIQNLVNDQSEK